MPKVRALLKDARVSRAMRSTGRICHGNRKKHHIEEGAVFLLVKNPSGAGYKNYCIICARKILDVVRGDLDTIESTLYSNE